MPSNRVLELQQMMQRLNRLQERFDSTKGLSKRSSKKKKAARGLKPKKKVSKKALL